MKTTVFIASASDCDDLRDLAILQFDAQNSVGGHHEFSVFDWRRDTDFGNFLDFQDKIFQSATSKWGKPDCDILVLLLWYKFGKDTVVEYDKYISTFVSTARLMVCHYNASVNPVDLDGCGIQKLFDWKKKVGRKWGEIATKRGSIMNVQQFQTDLARRISQYKDEKLLNKP